MGDLAHFVLKLDRGVMDMEVARQAFIHRLQDRFAFRSANIRNADVAGEGMGFAADTPYMEIVHIDDALDHAYRFPNSMQAYPPGVPSKRMFKLSRMIPNEDHNTSTPIPKDSAESTQVCLVSKMTQPPTITAAVESVSPSS